MTLIPPDQVKTPLSRIKEVEVLHDGTKHPFNEFSIAQLKLHNGETVYGIRWDRNSWSDSSEELGYPTSRGYPSWFILPPDMKEFISVLNKLNIP